MKDHFAKRYARFFRHFGKSLNTLERIHTTGICELVKKQRWNRFASSWEIANRSSTPCGYCDHSAQNWKIGKSDRYSWRDEAGRLGRCGIGVNFRWKFNDQLIRRRKTGLFLQGYALENVEIIGFQINSVCAVERGFCKWELSFQLIPYWTCLCSGVAKVDSTESDLDGDFDMFKRHAFKGGLWWDVLCTNGSPESLGIFNG